MLDDRIFRYHATPHPKNGEYYLTECVAQLAKKHPMIAIPASYWVPVASPEDIMREEKKFNSNIQCWI
jgi:hypothetical protein